MTAIATRRSLLLGHPAPSRVVAVIGDACLARHGVVCRSCGDVCPARAIRFQPIPRATAVPVLDAEACTGCGECIEVCPAAAISLPEMRRAG
jgi:ferredoxin-type protein NapF